MSNDHNNCHRKDDNCNNNNNINEYLALVPRGLQHVVQQMIIEEITSIPIMEIVGSCDGNQCYSVTVDVIGEDSNAKEEVDIIVDHDTKLVNTLRNCMSFKNDNKKKDNDTNMEETTDMNHNHIDKKTNDTKKNQKQKQQKKKNSNNIFDSGQEQQHNNNININRIRRNNVCNITTTTTSVETCIKKSIGTIHLISNNKTSEQQQQLKKNDNDHETNNEEEVKSKNCINHHVSYGYCCLNDTTTTKITTNSSQKDSLDDHINNNNHDHNIQSNQNVNNNILIKDVWTIPGRIQGNVCILIQTDAPPFIVSKLRCGISSLLSYVHSFPINLLSNSDNDNNNETSHHLRSNRCDNDNTTILNDEKCYINNTNIEANSYSQDGDKNDVSQMNHNNNKIHFRSLDEIYNQIDMEMKEEEEKTIVNKSNCNDTEKNEVNDYISRFNIAMTLWTQHVQSDWPIGISTLVDGIINKNDNDTKVDTSTLKYRLSCIRCDPILSKPVTVTTTTQTRDTKHNINKSNSKKSSPCNEFPYTRQQLLSKITDLIVPIQTNNSTNWKVDLKDYDLEVVVLVLQNTRTTIQNVATATTIANFQTKSDNQTEQKSSGDATIVIGLALRPYQYYKTRSYASGLVPADITPPYIHAGAGMVRLRPSTAQVLLHLAHLQNGDFILDPCVGVGTISIESTFLSNSRSQRSIISYGGDLVLMPSPFEMNKERKKEQSSSSSSKRRRQEWKRKKLLVENSSLSSPNDEVAVSGGDTYTLRNVAIKYKKDARLIHHNLSCRTRRQTPTNGLADLFGWDATNIPLRDGCVDAVISDLPFGQHCMTSKRLDDFIPLLMNEMARILQPNTGRMVLLCGSYIPILEALQKANHAINNMKDNNDNDELTPQRDEGNKTSNSSDDIAQNNDDIVNNLELIWTLPCHAVFPVTIGGHLAWIIKVYRGSANIVPSLPNRRKRIQALTMKREKVLTHIPKTNDSIITNLPPPKWWQA